MARPLKLFLIVVGLLLLSVIGALAYVAATFDPNDYRDRIAKIVKDKTGRDLVIGDIGLSIFPWLKIDLSKVSLSNAAGFGDKPFAEIGEAKVGVQLLPLLKERKITVDGIELEGLVLNLAKSADGKTNWDDLASKSKEPKEPEKPDEPSSFKLEDIDIGGIDISKAAITYRDAQTKQSYLIREFNLKTGALKPGKAFDVDTSIKAMLEAQKLDTEITLSAHVNPDLKTQDLELSGIKLTAKVKNPQQSGEATLTGDIGGNLNTKVFKTKDFKLAVKGKAPQGEGEATMTADVGANLVTNLFALGNLKLSAKGKTPTIDGTADLKGKVNADVANKRYEISGLALDGTASGKALPGGSQAFSLVSDLVRVDQGSGKGEVRKLLLKASGLEASSDLVIDGLNGDAPHFVGPLAIKPFNARELLAKFSAKPLETADPKVLTSVSVSSRVDGSSKRVKLDDLILKLDQTTATGSLSVKDFASMAMAFALKLDQIDADRYLPVPVVPPKAAPMTPAEKEALNKTEIPIEALNGLDIDGSLAIGKLKVKNVNIADVRVSIQGPKNSAKVATLAGKLYGGSFTANTRIAPGARPGYALTTSLQSIQLAPFLKDFMQNEKVSGTGTINLDVTTAGKTVGEAKKALNGDVTLNFNNGAVKGFNLGEMLRKGQALLRQQQYVPVAEPVETDFAAIDFTGKFVNGVLISDSLDARNPLLRLAGGGKIDIANETFDYTAKPTIVETSKGQGGRGLEELGGLTVPVRLTGTFADPKYKIDFAAMAKAKAKEEIKQQIGKQLGVDTSNKAEVKQKINEKLAPALEGLFGRKKKKQDAAPAEDSGSSSSSSSSSESSGPAEEKKEESAPATP